MAENRIRIEVDYGNAVARVGELELSFKQLENSAGKARQAIQKSLRDTETALAGTVKALSREKAALIETQSTLARNNEEYRKYQVQIDAVQKQIDRLTDTRRREEVVLKNSAAGIQQQIALLKEEQANRKLSNTQFVAMQQEIEKLEARYQSLTNTVRSGTIADFDRQIAQLKQEQIAMATSREEVERYEQQIEQLRIRKNALTGTTKGLDKASQSFSSSAGAAGATVTEFGRTIGDLPFGLIGITNNIQQLSQQFVDLQAKSGGTKGALEAIKATLMGPAGFVVAMNIVTSALLFFTRQSQKAKSETENFNEALLKNQTTLKNIADVSDEVNTSLENRNEILRAGASLTSDIQKLYEDESLTEEERNKRVVESLRLQAKLIGAEEKRNEFLSKNAEVLGENIMNEEDYAFAKERLAQLIAVDTELRQGAIQEILNEVNAQGERREALQQFLLLQLEVIDAEKAFKDSVDVSKTAQEEYAETVRDVNMKMAENQQELESERLKIRRNFLLEDIRATEENSDERYKLLGELYELNADIEKAISDERKERAQEEKDRLKDLKDLNQQYIDDLETQFDEYGLIRINQQERQAIAEAKALGASVGDLIRIQEFYEGERKKVIQKADEDLAKDKEKRDKDALKKNKERLKEFLEGEIEAMKSRVDVMSEVFKNFGSILDELNTISQARFDREIGRLREERDIIRSNDATTKEEKEQQLTDLRRKENEIQRQRIKAERDMFTLKQTIVLAEMVLKQRAFVQEKIMMAQMTAALAKQAGTNIAITAAEETGEATMSIGTFMKELGPWGIAAFALSIGGVIASIVSARRKAQAEIAGLSDAPVSLGGGGGGAAAPAAPSFNVVGASAQNQLAAAIAGQQSEPVRAYVVSSDVTTAQELDRKIVEGASI